ncbi:MAG: HAD family phosphatase [Candidatus Sumerlaeia bacterium]|nr:HAD family phosphatase [Candidatus Sumerlaeia bacterium]
MITNNSPGLSWNGRKIRGFLFDMDGVIADTREGHKKAWVRFLASEAEGMDLEQFMVENFGLGNREIFSKLHPDKADDPGFLDALGEEKESHFLDILAAGEVQPLSGYHAFTHGLQSRGVLMAAGSSAPRKNLVGVLETFAVMDRYSVVVSGSDVARAKPDPEIFIRCREGLGLEGSECIVLEDSMFGIEAGRKAGCHVIGLATTHPAGEIREYCDAVVSDYAELIRLLNW